jgi:hypothetical protein
MSGETFVARWARIHVAMNAHAANAAADIAFRQAIEKLRRQTMRQRQDVRGEHTRL